MKLQGFGFVLNLVFAFTAALGETHGDKEFHPVVTSPSFTAIKPTLCLDHSHSNLKIDDGRYQAAVGLFESDGFRVAAITKALHGDVLGGCAILYISAAMTEISSKEVSAIETFVAEGGALLLLGDHPPMGKTIEPLVRRFGVSSKLNLQESPSQKIPSLNDNGTVAFEGESQLNLKHPIIRPGKPNMAVNKVGWFGGEGLASEVKSAAPLLTFSDGTVGAYALEVKRGRVLIFGDSTLFTSKRDQNNEPLGMARPGSDNVNLLLNSVHWLMRTL